jgi:hypothetical protein
MTTTTRIIRSAIPGEGSGNYGYVALVTMPAAPWEQSVSKDEAWKQARELGAYVRTNHSEPKVKK